MHESGCLSRFVHSKPYPRPSNWECESAPIPREPGQPHDLPPAKIHKTNPFRNPRSGATLSSAAPDGPLPTVGVCIPGKNIEAFLPDALASLADQTHAPDEVMFIDDGSTDATAEIANQSSLVSTVLSGPKRWASGARNKGIRHMTSEIIVLLDGDDVLEPDWLARVAGVFARHPDVGVMCGQYTYMDESGRRLFTRAPAVNDWTPEGLRQRNVMAGGAGFAFRRASFWKPGVTTKSSHRGRLGPVATLGSPQRIDGGQRPGVPHPLKKRFRPCETVHSKKPRCGAYCALKTWQKEKKQKPTR